MSGTDTPDGHSIDPSSVPSQGSAGASGGSGAEATGAVSGPPPMPDTRPVPAPSLVPVTPVAGSKLRTVTWRLAGQEDGGRVLLLDVAVGGPPCDAVTGVDVSETAQAVTVDVHAGAVPSADCSKGVPARVGTARLRVRLAAPLGSRSLTGPRA